MKRLFFLLFIILSLFLSSGCSYFELNDLAIATALSIDYEDEKIVVSAQILNFETESGSTKKKALVYEGVGENVGEAIRNIYKAYPKKLHLGHLELIVVSEDAVTYKIKEILDYFLRSPEARNDCNFVIAVGSSAKSVLVPINSEETTFTSDEIIDSIKNAEKFQGTVFSSTLQDVSKSYLETGIMPAVTAVTFDNTDYSHVKSLNLVGIKKDNTLTPLIGDKEANSYNMINEHFSDIMIEVPFHNNKISVVLYKPKSNISVTLKDKPVFKISIDIEANISQIDQKYNLEKEAIVKEIEDSIEKEVNSYVDDLTKFCSDNDIDLVGLKQLIYKNHYNDYKKYKDMNLYKESNIKITSNVNLYRYGNTYKSIGDNDE